MNHPNRSKQQQAKHTPGPWFSKRRGTQGAANYAVIETAANWHTEIARVYFGDRFVNGEANARLIAAAPETAAERDRLKASNAELLAALKNAVAAFEHGTPDEGLASMEARSPSDASPQICSSSADARATATIEECLLSRLETELRYSGLIDPTEPPLAIRLVAQDILKAISPYLFRPNLDQARAAIAKAEGR